MKLRNGRIIPDVEPDKLSAWEWVIVVCAGVALWFALLECAIK